MVVTTSQVALQLYFVKNKPWWLAIAFFAIFGFVDCVLWGATLKKIPHGAWFSLSLGAALTLVMYFWTWATGLVTQFDNGNRVQLTALLSKTEDAPQSEAQVQAGASEERPRESAQLLFKLHDDVKVPLTRMPILAIFWKPSGGHGVPHAFARFLAQYPSCPRVVFFLSVRVLAVPHIPGPQRLLVDKVRSFEGFYGATLRLGYRDRNHLANLNEDLAASIIRLEATSAAANGKTREGKKRVEEIAEAAKIVTHVWVPVSHSTFFASYSDDRTFTTPSRLPFLASTQLPKLLRDGGTHRSRLYGAPTSSLADFLPRCDPARARFPHR